MEKESIEKDCETVRAIQRCGFMSAEWVACLSKKRMGRSDLGIDAATRDEEGFMS